MVFRKIAKSTFLSTLMLCASVTVALVPASSNAGSHDQDGLRRVAVSLERALPGLVSAKDYRSASNTAFLLATARSRLDQKANACAALSQSLEYYRMAIAKESGLPEERGAGLKEQSDGMAEVAAKFGCMHT
jgi:hypothetical protein